MNQAEMVERLSTQLDLPKSKAKDALKAIVEMLGKELKSGGRVNISGLGTFTVRARPARKGRNPKTGEAIKIKASKRVAFRAAPALNEVAAKFKGPK